VTPAASNAYNLWSLEPMHATSFATAGDDSIESPVAAFHSSVHVVGAPEQLDPPRHVEGGEVGPNSVLGTSRTRED
jgi:hypothetical protein